MVRAGCGNGSGDGYGDDNGAWNGNRRGVNNSNHGALKRAVIAKDWVRIARLYNGATEAVAPQWWKDHHPHWDNPTRYPADRWVPYHAKLFNAYNRITSHA